VIAQTPFEALRKLDAGAWKGVRWRNERVPSLEEALALVPDGKRLFIEIKCGEEILDPLAVLLKPWREKAKQIVLICFSYEVISAAKRRFAPFSCYWLVSIERDPATGGWDPDLKSIAEQAKEAGVDGVDLGNSPKLDAANARIFLDQGLELHVWTVNDARLARGLAAAGVQSITTDRPAWLRQRLRSSTESRDPGTP
jgi:glycerophosphoryl diester phosphodiesterase